MARAHTWFLTDAAIALGHYYNLLPLNAILLQGLADNDFRRTIRVDIGRVPSIQSFVIRCFEQGQRLKAVCQLAWPVSGSGAY
jgi:hypothetical protein